MATLYIVSTPIGNLKDISLRAIDVLKNVDLILCEDTRQTQKLLTAFKIKKPTLSYHERSQLKKVTYILNLLKKGKNLALVSDAGTPGISDPGNKLISFLTTRPGLVVRIVPIPGPSAVTAAASVSGFPMDKFIFLGFPPTKKKRKKFFEEVVNSKYPVIFYETPHRLIRTLTELHEITICQERFNEFQIVVCRELTKKFETVYRGEIKEVIGKIEKNKILGEFVIIVRRAKRKLRES